MRAIRGLFLLLSLVCLAGLPRAVLAGDDGPADDLGMACIYHRPALAQASADRPKFTPADDLALDGMQLPAYSLSLSDGGGRPGSFASYRPDATPPHPGIKQKAAAQLAVYAIPGGSMLVPRGWQPRVGALGADGSFFVVFAPDDTGQTYMSISNTAACIGCAYSSASWYFKQAVPFAKAQGFAYCRSTRGVKSVRVSRVQRTFRINSTGGNPVDGVAYFNPDDDQMFYEVEISVPASQHALAMSVLKQFLIPEKSK